MTGKIKVIDAIANRHPDACWADLVTWKQFGSPQLSDAVTSGAKCKREKGGCYCGKYKVKQ